MKKTLVGVFLSILCIFNKQNDRNIDDSYYCLLYTSDAADE